MSYDRSVITLAPHATTAIVDAVQRTIVDKGASRATRKAALSALLALVDAGLMKGSALTNLPAKGDTAAADMPVGRKWLLMSRQG